MKRIFVAVGSGEDLLAHLVHLLLHQLRVAGFRRTQQRCGGSARLRFNDVIVHVIEPQIGNFSLAMDDFDDKPGQPNHDEEKAYLVVAENEY